MGKKSKNPQKKKANSVTAKKEDVPSEETTEAAYRFMRQVELRPSPIHGLGTFATQHWPKPPKPYCVNTANFNLDYNRLGLIRMNSSSIGPWRKLLVQGLLDNNTISSKTQSTFSALTEQQRSQLRATWEEYAIGKNNNNDNDHHIQQGANFRCWEPTRQGTTITVLTDLQPGQEILRHYGHEWLGIKYFDLKACFKYVTSRIRDYPLEQKAATEDNKVLVFPWDMNNLDHRLNSDTKTGGCPVDPNVLLVEGRSFPSLQDNNNDDNTDEDLVAVTLDEIGFWADCLEYLADTYLAGSKDLTMQLMWAGKKAEIDKYCP